MMDLEIIRCTCERVNGRLSEVDKDCPVHGYAGEDEYWSRFWNRLKVDKADWGPGWK